MKTKKEIKKWLLKNCINYIGNLDLSELDFSDFKGNVIIGQETRRDISQRIRRNGL